MANQYTTNKPENARNEMLHRKTNRKTSLPRISETTLQMGRNKMKVFEISTPDNNTNAGEVLGMLEEGDRTRDWDIEETFHGCECGNTYASEHEEETGYCSHCI